MLLAFEIGFFIIFGFVAFVIVVKKLDERKAVNDQKKRDLESRRFEEQQEQRRKYYIQQSRDLALTCKSCGSLGMPISGSLNRYRCGCGKQFAGAAHNLVDPG